MNALIVGTMVSVSALLPSNASTISGNPAASVSSPMVICGSRRRSFENPAHGTRRSFGQLLSLPSAVSRNRDT